MTNTMTTSNLEEKKVSFSFQASVHHREKSGSVLKPQLKGRSHGGHYLLESDNMKILFCCLQANFYPNMGS